MWWEEAGESVLRKVIFIATGVDEGVAQLIWYFRSRCPHAVWDQIALLDYQGDAASIRSWFLRQLPRSANDGIFFFAFWDVTDGFSLGGAESWSIEPDGWWFEGNFRGESYGSPVLKKMRQMAKDADPFPHKPGGVFELVEYLLTIGYVALTATQMFRNNDLGQLLGGRGERWVITGFPDSGEAITVGKATGTGFIPSDPSTPVAKLSWKGRRDAAKPVKQLVRELDSEVPESRFWAAVALSSKGDAAIGAIPSLIKRLDDTDIGTRLMSAKALMKINPRSLPAVSALVEILKSDPSPDVRYQIASDLGASDLPESVAALAESLCDEDFKVRYYSVIALKVLGVRAKVAALAIRKALATETDSLFRAQAEAALRQIEFGNV